MQIENLMENKNVLMVPVYSARSYDTNLYDLAADGNVSKYLMKILKSNANSIDIFYPDNSKNYLDIIAISNKYAKCKVNWIPVRYGENALKTRNMGDVFLEYIFDKKKKYDIIITEINSLALNVAVTGGNEFCNKENLLYWVGTHNMDGLRWDACETVNKMIAKEINTACLMPAQKECFKGKSFNDKYEYDPTYFDKKIIFFPFRLSDKAYNLETFKSIIYKMLEKGESNFKVLYSDVNDSHILDNEPKDVFIKVPSNKYVYQAILKGKPIIIYLDDLIHNSHSNIFEFNYYGCEIIMFENDVISLNENIHFVKNNFEIEEKLIELLRR